MKITLFNGDTAYECVIGITDIDLLRKELNTLLDAGYKISNKSEVSNEDSSNYSTGSEGLDKKWYEIIGEREIVLPQLAYIVMRLLSSYTEYIKTVKAINAYNGMHLLENIEERLCNARNRCKLKHSNLTEMKEASEDLYRLAKLRDLGETLKRCTQQFQEAFISLMNYRNSSESIDIDDRIACAIGEYNALINIGKQAYAAEKSNIYDGVDVKSGINAYDEYLRLKMNKENGEVFDAEALRNSYDAITNLFQVTQPLRMQLPVSKK